MKNILKAKINNLIFRKRFRELIVSFFWSVFVMIFLFLTISIIDYMTETGDEFVKSLTSLSWFVFSALVLISFVNSMFIRQYDLINETLEIEKKLSSGEKTHNILSSAVSFLENDNSRFGFSEYLINETIRNAEKKYKNENFSRTINYKKIFIPVIMMILCINIILISTLSPIMLESIYRTLRSISFNTLGPEPGDLKIIPGDKTIIYGSTLRIKVSGTNMPAMKINYVYSGEKEIRSRWMKKNRDGFETVFRGLSRNLKYQVKTLREESPWFRIKTFKKPFITKMNIEYKFPEYTGLSNMVDDESRNISAVYGTEINLFARSSKKIKRAEFIFNTSEIEMKKNLSIEAEHNFTLKESGKYRIRIMDDEGYENDNGTSYRIDVTEDKIPEVLILKPSLFIEWDRIESPEIAYRIEDDYGITSCELIVSIDKKTESVNLFSNSENTRRRISNIDLKIPDEIKNNGGTIAYYIRAVDNDTVKGPKTGKSRMHIINIPTPMKKIKKHEEFLETTEARLMRLKEKEEELITEEMKLVKQIEKSMIPDVEEKKAAEFLIYKQKNIVAEAREIQKMLKEEMEKVKDNPFIKSGMIEKMMKMQKLMQEVLSPELMEIMQELDEAMEKVNLTKKDFQKFNKFFNPKEMAEKFDRMIKLLEKMKQEQQLHSLAKELEKLKEKQAELQNEIDKLNENKNLENDVRENTLKQFEKHQKEISAELFLAQEKLKSLMEKIGKYSEDAEKKLKEADGHMDQALKHQQDVSDELKKGEGKNSSSSSKKAMKKMSDAISAINSSSSQLSKQRQEDIKNDLLKCAELSFQISLSMNQLNKRITGIRILKNERFEHLLEKYYRKTASTINQTTLSSSLIMHTLTELTRKTFSINPEIIVPVDVIHLNLKKMENLIMERRINETVRLMSQTVSSSNRLTVYFLEKYYDMKCNGGKSLFEEYLEKMQKLAEMQGKLNQQMQGMSMGEGMSMEMMKQMAMEQSLISKGMGDVAESFDESSAMRKRLMELKDEMQDLQAEYLKRNINEKIKERQKILHQRMLETVKAMKQEGEDKERKANAALGFKIKKKHVKIETEKERKSVEAIKQMKREVYPDEYEEIIKLYFENISR